MEPLTRCFKSTPIPAAGLMLGLAGVGNLLQPYGTGLRYFSGMLSFLFILLLIGRIITDASGVLQEINNPVVASVAPCFSMGIILLAGYLAPFAPEIAELIWYSGIILHFIFVIIFSYKYLINFEIKKVYPSYFIVYVGMVTASVTAPEFNSLNLGQLIFWAGFLGYMIFLPVVCYRVFIIKKLSKKTLPTLTIFTAPAGLCLTGYISVFPDKNMFILAWLTLLTVITVTSVVLYLPKMLEVGFCPGYSAFTFPFVITALGLRLTGEHIFQEYGLKFLQIPVRFIEFLALSLVIFVLLLYLNEIIISSFNLPSRKNNF